LLLAVISVDGNQTVAAPAGWTALDNGQAPNNAASLGVFYKLATSSEPANYAFTWGAGEQAVGAIMRYSNIDTANPIDVTSGITATGNSNFPTSPDITTNSPNTTVVYAYAADSKYGENFQGPYNPTGTTGIYGFRSKFSIG